MTRAYNFGPKYRTTDRTVGSLFRDCRTADRQFGSAHLCLEGSFQLGNVIDTGSLSSFHMHLLMNLHIFFMNLAEF